METVLSFIKVGPNGTQSINRIFHPKVGTRYVAPEVPKEFAEDFTEACLVLADSPKASAALSRRCLQNLIHNIEKIKERDLNQEIQKLLDSNKLPSEIASALDSIRIIGNFAAHPIKFQHSGEIADVEAGEAEWSLETVEALFDFYFVRPAALQAKKDALNKKLAAAGKPLLK